MAHSTVLICHHSTINPYHKQLTDNNQDHILVCLSGAEAANQKTDQFTQISPINPTPAACAFISGTLPSILPASNVSAPGSTDDDSNAALI